MISSSLFFSFIGSLAVCLMLIPMLVASAGRLDIIDFPGDRKIHASPIAKVGGVGFGVGAFVAILLWAPKNEFALSFLLGGLIILLFGIWDDRVRLNYKVKFLGQFTAAGFVLWQTGLRIHSISLVPEYELPLWLSVPLTLLFVVGVTNAFNLSDGLDGLAGGMSILSLCGMTFLAYESGNATLVIILVSVLGGLLGFMRFNTFPARIFMGDGGSQLLGFSLAVASLFLIDPLIGTYSFSICLLLLGLPVLDTLCVMVQRIREGRSPFFADKNHIHHKLLARGFSQSEAVILIYGCQTLLLSLALLLRWYPDVVSFGVYVGCSAVVFVLFFFGMPSFFHLETKLRTVLPSIEIHDGRFRSWISYLSLGFVGITIPVFLSLGVFLPAKIPVDFGYLSLTVLFLLMATLLFVPSLSLSLVRVGLYTGSSLLLYLMERYPLQADALVQNGLNVFFALLAIAVLFAIQFHRKGDFQITPLDYLIVFIAIALPFLFEFQVGEFALWLLTTKLLILFFSFELLLTFFQSKLALFKFQVLWLFCGMGVLSLWAL